MSTRARCWSDDAASDHNILRSTRVQNSAVARARQQDPGDRVVPLSAQMIALRFTTAALAAGIESRVTAHSGRVGLASELTSRGASTTDVMLAGEPLRATCREVSRRDGKEESDP